MNKYTCVCANIHICIHMLTHTHQMLVSLRVGDPFYPCRYPFNPYTWYAGLTERKKKERKKRDDIDGAAYW